MTNTKLLSAALALLLLPAGCASSTPTAGEGRGASYRVATNSGGEPDANGHPRGPNERGYVTGSNIPLTPEERLNNPNGLGATRVYDRDDLLRRGGGLSPDDSLRRLDPDFAISGGR